MEYKNVLKDIKSNRVNTKFNRFYWGGLTTEFWRGRTGSGAYWLLPVRCLGRLVEDLRWWRKWSGRVEQEVWWVSWEWNGILFLREVPDMMVSGYRNAAAGTVCLLAMCLSCATPWGFVLGGYNFLVTNSQCYITNWLLFRNVPSYILNWFLFFHSVQMLSLVVPEIFVILFT